jgi:hypothetical protein
MIMRHSARAPLLLLVVLPFLGVWLLAGCSRDPLGRHGVSGTVNVDGAPLAKGEIRFQPSEGQPTSGGSVVREGKFSIPRDMGLVPGKYRVEINAPVPGTGGKVDEKALPGEPLPKPQELIPKEWNTASNQFIDVKQSGPFTFTFDVATKK